MQIFKINDPETQEEKTIQAAPIQLEERQGWTVCFEGGDKESILVIDEQGIWKQVDGDDLKPALVSVI